MLYSFVLYLQTFEKPFHTRLLSIFIFCVCVCVKRFSCLPLCPVFTLSPVSGGSGSVLGWLAPPGQPWGKRDVCGDACRRRRPSASQTHDTLSVTQDIQDQSIWLRVGVRYLSKPHLLYTHYWLIIERRVSTNPAGTDVPGSTVSLCIQEHLIITPLIIRLITFAIMWVTDSPKLTKSHHIKRFSFIVSPLLDRKWMFHL